jgi:hypothetical protein
MVTTEAAAILHLHRSAGRLAPGGRADLIVARDRGLAPGETLLELCSGGLELVLVGGRVKLVSERLAQQLPDGISGELRPLRVEGSRTVLVAAELERLERLARASLGAPLRLAGKTVEVPA